MAKQKSTITKVVETVEGWVGMGPKKKAGKTNTTKTVKPNAKTKTKAAPPDNIKKGNKVVKKRK